MTAAADPTKRDTFVPITPERAQQVLAAHSAGTLFNLNELGVALARTVASEPERTRAAAVKALRDFRDSFDSFDSEYDNAIVAAIADERADAIKNGAPFTP